MKVNGTYTIEAPKETVWPMLLDPYVLANVMPGCEKLEQIGDDQYEGILKIKVGPVQGKFNGTVQLSDIQEPESYTITLDGKGAPGFVKGTGSLKLEAEGDHTILHYDGDAQVGGRLASVGQRLLDTSAKAIIRQSLEGLEKQVEMRQAPASTESADMETAVSAPTAAPSQTEFALGVAKNMWEDMMAEQDQQELMRKVLILVGGILAAYIFVEWWTSKIARKVSKKIQ